MKTMRTYYPIPFKPEPHATKPTCRSCEYCHKPSDDGFKYTDDAFGVCTLADMFVRCDMDACEDFGEH